MYQAAEGEPNTLPKIPCYRFCGVSSADLESVYRS